MKTLKGNLIAIFSLVACATGHAQFTTVAYDGFNYSSGSLAGDNGGTGWTSAWQLTYGNGGNFNVSTSGMPYSGLSTTGGSIVWGSGGASGISEDSRTLPLQDSGLVYFQFLSQFSSTTGGGTPTIRLMDSGTLTGGFGANGSGVTTMSILNSSLNPSSSSTSASLANANLTIALIDYETDSTEMWVNPDLSTFNYQDPPTPDATYSGLAPAFDTIAIYSRSPAQLDELTIMMEPAPEPSSIVFLGLGGVLWCLCRRGRGLTQLS